jgi:protease-4
MDSITDYLFDRRQLRRKLSFWRVAAVLCLIIAAGTATWRMMDGGQVAHLQPHIARLNIEGVITGDRATLKLIDDISQSHASAVIVSIESPGGSTSGSERVYDALRRLSQKKPVVAVVGGMAASGGYIAAMGTDHIVAQGTSLVGSIGVLFQYPNASKLLDTVGVKMEEVKSSPLKAAPNPFEPASPEARAALADLVKDSYDWFKALVRERRQLDGSALAAVTDGRVFTGRQAIGLKLIDELGSEKEAIAWLEAEKNVAKDLPVRDWRRRRGIDNLGILGMASLGAQALGFHEIAQGLARAEQMHQSAVLDGLMSIWHASSVN